MSEKSHDGSTSSVPDPPLAVTEASPLVPGKGEPLVNYYLAEAPLSFVIKVGLPLCLANACDAIETMSAGYMLPQLQTEFPKHANQIASSVFFGMLAGALLAGPLLVRLGPQRLLVVSMLAEATCAAAGSCTHSELRFLAWRVLAGCSVGAGVPALFGLAEALLQPEFRRHKVVNLISAFWAIGTLMAAVIAWACFAYLRLTWRQYYAITGIVPLVIAFLVQWLVPEAPLHLQSRGRDAELEQLSQQIGAPPKALVSTGVSSLSLTDEMGLEGASTSLAISDDGVLTQMAALCKEPWLGNLIKFTVAGFGAAFAWYGMGTWLLIVFKDVGIKDTYVAAMVFAASGLPGAFFRHILVGIVSGRVLWAAALAASCVCCLSLAHLASRDTGHKHLHPQTAALIICTFNTISTSTFNVQVTIWGASFPSKLQPLAIDIQSVFMRIAAILAILVDGGALQSGSVVTMGLVSASILATAALSALYLDI